MMNNTTKSAFAAFCTAQHTTPAFADFYTTDEGGISVAFDFKHLEKTTFWVHIWGEHIAEAIAALDSDYEFSVSYLVHVNDWDCRTYPDTLDVFNSFRAAKQKKIVEKAVQIAAGQALEILSNTDEVEEFSNACIAQMQPDSFWGLAFVDLCKRDEVIDKKLQKRFLSMTSVAA